MQPAWPGPHRYPGAHRFSAKAGYSRGTWAVVIVGQLAVVGVAGLLAQVVPSEVLRAIFPIVLVGALIGYGLWMVKALAGRDVSIDVSEGRVIVDGGRGGQLPIAGALLGPWREAYTGTVTGTVLHLHDGSRTLRIGGRDHRAAPGLPLAAPPADTVDVYLPAADFDELLRYVWAAGSQGAPVAPAIAVVRCALMPNPATGGAGLRMILPWLGTIAGIILVVVLAEVSGLGDTPMGRMVMMGLTIPLIVAGLGLTIWRSMRKKGAAFYLEVDAREVRLRDGTSAALLASAPRAAVRMAVGVHRLSARNIQFDYPVIALPLPGREDLSVGVYDDRFFWTMGSPEAGHARYLVGPPDWLALTEAVGIRQLMGVRQYP